MTYEEWKLAAAKIGRFTDSEIEKMFLDLVMITTVKKIREGIGILETHRPEVIQRLKEKYALRKRKPPE